MSPISSSNKSIGIKKRGKADRKAYTEKLANEAKHAASVQDMQVKTLAGKFQSPDILVKD